jgi:arylsulfatase A-like enzyme
VVSETSPADEPAPPGDRTLIRGLRIFGLCGLAVAQPLLDVLGGGVAFFVTHDASRLEVLLVTASVLLVPTALLTALVALARLRSPEAGDRAMAGVVGLLVAVTVASAIDRASTLPLGAYAALAVSLTVAAALAYGRLEPVRTFTTFLAPAPLLFAGVFLFLSPVSALVLGGDPDALAAGGTGSMDVVMVVFDELPLGALLDDTGEIDEERFPGFARLAASSTWYPNATTVAPETTAAVPALLTGRLPEVGEERDAVPVAAEHPRSLFTMLAESHELRVHEWVTRLCPADLCDERRELTASEPPSLLRDVSVVAGHQVLPERLAEQLLPSISGQWAGFGEESPTDTGDGTLQPGGDPGDDESPAPADDDEADGGETPALDPEHDDEATSVRRDSEPAAFTAAMSDLEAERGPLLWFVHERLPHRPQTRLPDGTSYPRAFRYDWWSNQREDAAVVYRQQYLLQVQYVDRLLDGLLEHLERHALDEAMVIVASDHGLSFQPHGHPRALSNPQVSELNDVLPVPLFVRYPGQGDGEVDLREAQLIDVVPTVADVLGVQLPQDWAFDGRSLQDQAPTERPRFWQPLGELPDALATADAMQFARESHELFGPSGGVHDLYGVGPHRDLLGESPLRGQPVEEAAVEPLHLERYDAVAPGSGTLPAFYEAWVTGVEPGRWVAVTVNGVVAGTGLVLDRPDPPARLKVMLDPVLFRPGSNDIEVLLIDEDSSSLRPLPLAEG